MLGLRDREAEAIKLVRYPAADRIPFRLLDFDAVKVIRRLRNFGHTAYLVGGCVRDLLLGLEPKDFDIATDARPRQVKRLFNNSRIIGRRFRLVHITFNRKVLEISTFRTAARKPADAADQLIRLDNEFGKPHEDAWRRDLTVNGLFYDIEAGEVLDYVGGLEDLERRVIRTIGNPWVRFREDPVRMLRAIKFAGRLGFRLADDLYQALIDCRDDIQKAAPPRLLEEILRLMNMGRAAPTLRLLYKTGFMHLLLPEVARPLDERCRAGNGDAFFKTFECIDRRGSREDPFRSQLLLSCLFGFALNEEIYHAAEEGRALHIGDLEQSIEDLIRPAAVRLRISRRDIAGLKQILKMQRYLAHSDLKGRHRKRAMAAVNRDYFPDALTYFAIQAECSDAPAKNLEFWTARWKESHRRH